MKVESDEARMLWLNLNRDMLGMEMMNYSDSQNLALVSFLQSQVS